MKIFTKQTTIRNFTGSLGVVFLLSQISCRTSDTENNLAGGSAAVKINLLGTEFSNSQKPKPTASLGKQGLDLGNNGVQSKSIMINPSTFIIARLAPVNQSLNTQASVGKNLSAAIPGRLLRDGIMFRVIAYEQGSGNYKTHQDYTIGQPAAPLMLDNSAPYIMVVYSYGSNSLPSISSGETTDLNSAVVNYDDNNRNFMYQNISYTPVNAQNTLDITLRHKTTEITTSVLSNLPGNEITSITNAAIVPHYTNGTIPLASGNITGRTDIASAAVDFSFLSSPATSITTSPIYVNADTGGANTASFSANAVVGGNPRTINVSNAFSITPGWQQSLTVNFSHCGAFIAPGIWKDFMCHNLGADFTADPFVPSAAIQGAKYQWGVQTGATIEVERYVNGVLTPVTQKQYISQTEDLSSPTTTIPDWYVPRPEELQKYPSAPWDTAWQDDIKGDKDPCPNGYRVPTKEQWQAVIDNNTFSVIGLWDTAYTDYSSGVYFGKGLFLPSTGERGSNGRPLAGPNIDPNHQLMKAGNYWSSSKIITKNSDGLYKRDGYFISANENKAVIAQAFYPYGHAIRCIQE